MPDLALTVSESVTDSELFSIRAAIFDLFGGPQQGEPPILLQRDERVSRPYWRIDLASPTTLAPEASGWMNGTRIYTVGFYGASQREVMRRIDRLYVAIRSGFPFFFYDARWVAPFVAVVPDATGLPAGAYTVSASVYTSPSGPEFLPSRPQAVTLTEPSRIEVHVPGWPWQNPVNGVARAYLGAGVTPRLLAAEGASAIPARGASRLDLHALPASTAAPEPTASKVYGGWLDPSQVIRNVYESTDRDGDFDGVLSLYVTRPLFLDREDGVPLYPSDGVIVSDVTGSP